MTQKLILMGFLAMSVKSIGMEPEEYKISESDIKSGSSALGLAVEKKIEQEREKLHEFDEFNRHVISYFSQDMTFTYREYFIKNLRKKILPKMLTYTKKDKKLQAYFDLSRILEEPDSVIAANPTAAQNLFASIYLLYLNKHPNESCFVLSDHYFKEKYPMTDGYCRFFIGIVLSLLNSYVTKQLSYYPKKDGLDCDKLSESIFQVSSYVKNFKDRFNTSSEFQQYQRYVLDFNIQKRMEDICEKLQGAKLVPTLIAISQMTPEEKAIQDLSETSQVQRLDESPVQIPETSTDIFRRLADQAEAQMPQETNKVDLPSSSKPQHAVSAQPESVAQQETRFRWFDRKIREGFWGAMESISSRWKRLFYRP